MRTDVLVIGGGAAGVSAACSAAQQGARVILTDPEPYGGILNRCIHNGFGLGYFGEDLTGPEYASRLIKMLKDNRIQCYNSLVTSLTPDLQAELVSPYGIRTIKATSVVLATGSREKAYGALQIGGYHCAGIMTAGEAQKLINLGGHTVGKRIVILGSGDIGLIMARRFTLKGAKVECVVEMRDCAGGLTRNVSQCLNDFNIPLVLSSTVVEVRGKSRLSEVVIAEVDRDGKPVSGTERVIPCDTLVLSVGLIPVVNLIPYAKMDSVTKGPLVNSHCQTSIDGLFACGNALHVHDLADNASIEGALAGKNAGLYALGKITPTTEIEVLPDEGIASVVPKHLVIGETSTLYVKVNRPYKNAKIYLGDNVLKSGPLVPNETIVADVRISNSYDLTLYVAEEGV